MEHLQINDHPNRTRPDQIEPAVVDPNPKVEHRNTACPLPFGESSMRHYLVVESLRHVVHLVLSDDRHARVALFRLDWDKRAWAPERVGDDRVLLLGDILLLGDDRVLLLERVGDDRVLLRRSPTGDVQALLVVSPGRGELMGMEFSPLPGGGRGPGMRRGDGRRTPPELEKRSSPWPGRCSRSCLRSSTAGRPNSGCELIFLLPAGQRLGCSRQMVPFEATGKCGFKLRALESNLEIWFGFRLLLFGVGFLGLFCAAFFPFDASCAFIWPFGSVQLHSD
jgi:hypothetical protein